MSGAPCKTIAWAKIECALHRTSQHQPTNIIPVELPTGRRKLRQWKRCHTCEMSMCGRKANVRSVVQDHRMAQNSESVLGEQGKKGDRQWCATKVRHKAPTSKRAGFHLDVRRKK